MAVMEQETKASSDEQVCQDVVTRIASVPLVSSAYDKVSATYAATKDDHPLVKSIFDAAETGIKKVATVAASGVQPILTNLEPQIAVVNEYVCQGLDKLEEKFSILQQPVDKVILEAKELLSSTVASAKGAFYHTVAGAKSAVAGMVDRAKEAVQGSMETTKTMLTSGMDAIMESTVGEKVVNIIDILLVRPEDWMDNFLPIADEELAKFAIPFEGLNSITVERQKQQRRYFVRLGALSAKLRRRAYQHSLAKMRKTKQHFNEALTKVQRTVDLIEYTKKIVDLKRHDLQENMNHMWLAWCMQEPGLAQGESLMNEEQIQSQVLIGLCTITDHLRVVSCSLAAAIQGLPNDIQEHIQQVQNSIGDLHAYFSTAASFQDLSGNIISQSKQKVNKARESLDGLLDYLVYNVPMCWLVGPFTPSEEPANTKVEGEKLANLSATKE